MTDDEPETVVGDRLIVEIIGAEFYERTSLGIVASIRAESDQISAPHISISEVRNMNGDRVSLSKAWDKMNEGESKEVEIKSFHDRHPDAKLINWSADENYEDEASDLLGSKNDLLDGNL